MFGTPYTVYLGIVFLCKCVYKKCLLKKTPNYFLSDVNFLFSLRDIPYISRQILGKKAVFKNKNKKERSKKN